jgi:hypothetical protein
MTPTGSTQMHARSKTFTETNVTQSRPLLYATGMHLSMYSYVLASHGPRIFEPNPSNVGAIIGLADREDVGGAVGTRRVQPAICSSRFPSP